jgi:hypothetical protein
MNRKATTVPPFFLMVIMVSQGDIAKPTCEHERGSQKNNPFMCGVHMIPISHEELQR